MIYLDIYLQNPIYLLVKQIIIISKQPTEVNLINIDSKTLAHSSGKDAASFTCGFRERLRVYDVPEPDPKDRPSWRSFAPGEGMWCCPYFTMVMD